MSQIAMDRQSPTSQVNQDIPVGTAKTVQTTPTDKLHKIILQNFKTESHKKGTELFEEEKTHNLKTFTSLSTALAKAPLFGANAQRAKQAETLLADVKTTNQEKLKTFEALRQEALKNANPETIHDTKEYFDAMARVLLLQPLTSALAKGYEVSTKKETKDASAIITHILYTETDAIFNADTEDRLEQIQSELDANKELFKTDKMLNESQLKTFANLKQMIDLKKQSIQDLAITKVAINTMQETGAAKKNMADLLDDISPLKDTQQTTKQSLPPFPDLVLQNLEPTIQEMKTAIFDFSQGQFNKIKDQADTLFELFRTKGNTLDTQKIMTNITSALSKASLLMMPELEQKLNNTLEELKFSQDVASLSKKVNILLKDSMTSIPGIKAFLETAEWQNIQQDRPAAEQDKVIVDEMTKNIERKMNLLEAKAIAKIEREIEIFKRDKENARTDENFDKVISDIETYLNKTDSLNSSSNISEKTKTDLLSEIGEIQRNCTLAKFQNIASTVGSTRRQSPSMQELQGLLREKENISPDIRLQLQNEIKTESANTKTRLETRITDLQSKLSSMDLKQLRTLRSQVEEMTTSANRCLIEPDLTDTIQTIENFTAEVKNTLANSSFTSDTRLDELQSSQLNKPQVETLKNLLKESWANPVLINSICTQEPQALAQFLDTIQIAIDAKGNPIALANQASKSIDALTLDAPSLDDFALELKLQCTAPDDAQKITINHQSSRANREIAKLLTPMVTNKELQFLNINTLTITPDLLVRLLEFAASDTDSSLKSIDLMLLQTIWLAKQADGSVAANDFDAFQKTLPESLKNKPNIQNIINIGFKNVANSEKLAKQISKISNTLASNEILAFCERLSISDDKWRALKIQNTIVHSLLKVHSLTGAQAMNKANAYILSNKINQLLNNTPEGLENLSEQIRIAFNFAHTTTVQDYTVQLENFMEKAPQLQKSIQAILTRVDELVAAQELIESNKQQKINDIRTIRGERSNLENIKGATLSLAVLAINEILNNPQKFGDLEQQKSLISSITFQKNINIKEMHSSAGLIQRADPLGEQFLEIKKALCESKTQEDFDKNKKDLLNFVTNNKLKENAEAILYLKSIEKNKSATDATKSKLNKINLTEDSALSKHMLATYPTLMGTGSRQTQAIDFASAEQAKDIRAVDKLSNISTFFSMNVNKTLNSATRLAVITAFIDLDMNSIADLKKQVDEHKSSLQELDIFKSAVANMEKLGINTALANINIMKFLNTMQTNTFQKIDEDTASESTQNKKNAQLDAKIPTEIKNIMTAEKALSVSEKLVANLATGSSYSFNIKTSVGVNIPITTSTKIIDIEIALKASLAQGMCLWKDDSGFHLTLAKTGEAGIGVSIDGICDILSVSANANLSLGTGCDLIFNDDKKCTDFLASLLANQLGKSTDVFSLCSEVKILHEVAGGFTAELSAELSTDKVDWLKATLTANAFVSGAREERNNSLETTIKTALKYGVSLKGELEIDNDTVSEVTAVTEKILEVAQEVDNRDIQKAAKTINKIKEKLSTITAPEFFSIAVDEERKITTSPDKLFLRDIELVKTIHVADMAQALLLLEKYAVPQSLIIDLINDMEALDIEKADIKIISTMKPTAIEECNAQIDNCDSVRRDKSNFELSNIELSFEKTNIEKKIEFDLKYITFAHNRTGKELGSIEYNPKMAVAV